MADSRGGLWVVIYTEFVANVACFVLWEFYDTYRLWWLSRTRVLGCQADVDELLIILRLIESIHFSRKDGSWTRRGNFSSDHSPGREGLGAHFVYFDPWQKARISEAEAIALVKASCRSKQPKNAVCFVYAAGLKPYDLEDPSRDFKKEADAREALKN